MATIELTCWKCGTEVPGVPVPVSRREECPQCISALRSCRGCQFHQPDAGRPCAEPQADPVADPASGNTCDYFRPRKPTGQTGADEAKDARAKLDALFGGGGGKTTAGGLADQARAFKKEGDSEAEAARKKLAEMFGGKKE